MRPSLILLLIATLLVTQGCEEVPIRTAPKLPSTDNMVGLTSLTTLQPDSTTIVLSDFFIDASRVDSVAVDSPYTVRYNGGTEATIHPQGEAPPYSDFSVWMDGHRWILPLRKARKMSYTMFFDSKGQEYESVAIAGNFNGWSATKNTFVPANGRWQTTLHLNSGSYQYQFVLDGNWQLDLAGE